MSSVQKINPKCLNGAKGPTLFLSQQPVCAYQSKLLQKLWHSFCTVEFELLAYCLLSSDSISLRGKISLLEIKIYSWQLVCVLDQVIDYIKNYLSVLKGQLGLFFGSICTGVVMLQSWWCGSKLASETDIYFPFRFLSVIRFHSGAADGEVHAEWLHSYLVWSPSWYECFLPAGAWRIVA